MVAKNYHHLNSLFVPQDSLRSWSAQLRLACFIQIGLHLRDQTAIVPPNLFQMCHADCSLPRHQIRQRRRTRQHSFGLPGDLRDHSAVGSGPLQSALWHWASYLDQSRHSWPPARVSIDKRLTMRSNRINLHSLHRPPARIFAFHRHFNLGLSLQDRMQ
jgi:hypothetical protein